MSDHGNLSQTDESMCRGNSYLAIAIVAIALLTLGLSLVWSRARTVIEGQQLSSCIGQTSEIAYMIEEYRQRHGSYPPAVQYDKDGEPMHSWRMLILQSTSGYSDYDLNEKWNSPKNRKFFDRMPACYKCITDKKSPPNHTSYLAITGPGTIFPNDHAVRSEDITDDPTTTIVIAETTNSGVHWMEPIDFDIRKMSFKVNDYSRPSIRSHHEDGARAVFVGNIVTGWISPDTPESTVKAMTTISGGEVIELKR